VHEEASIDIYLLLFLLIVGIGSVAGYIFYLREKNEHLHTIRTGICPRCKKKSIVLSDQRGGGCGPKLVTFTCTECGYQNSFSMNGSCGI
jgi:DNA-directed RNA polymerase subunit M/transcription elongation factor TFIIS